MPSSKKKAVAAKAAVSHKGTGGEEKNGAALPDKKKPLAQKGAVALGVAVAAVVASKMFLGGAPLAYVDVRDEAMLRRIFFPTDGEVWAVACETSPESHEIPEMFEAVAVRLAEEMKFAVVDCSAKLPGSGRSTMQRWKLKAADKPVIFVANGAQTTQLPATRSEYDLVRELRLASVRRPHEVRNDESFREKCLYKPACLFLLRGGAELEAGVVKRFDALAARHSPRVQFASVDAAEWRINIEGFEAGDQVKLRRFESGSHRALFLANHSDGFHRALSPKFDALESFLDQVHDDHLMRLVREDDATEPLRLALVKRPKRAPPKKPQEPPKNPLPEARPKPPPSSQQQPPETPEELEQRRRDREARRRDQMERETANSAFVAESAEDDDVDHGSGGDDDDIQDLDDVQDLDNVQDLDKEE